MYHTQGQSRESVLPKQLQGYNAGQVATPAQEVRAGI